MVATPLETEELQAWLRLALADGVGNVTARKLLAAFGLPQAIFQQSPATLLSLVSARQAQSLLTEPADLAPLLAQTRQWLDATSGEVQRRLITLADASYPQPLLDTPDPPLLLYAMGQVSVWLQAAHPAIAMVGSRNPTPQGASNARQLARSLAQAGLVVVSGMALGIDGASHEGALDALPAADDGVGPVAVTVAVVGTGLDRVYPRQHHGLAQRIARHGVLISEYPLGTPALAANFPKRNRIIAGLSMGTLVVEAALQSGSLITARLAGEYGREVFAIPGSIHSPQARGCHLLIRQGAKLVESAPDILEELRLPATPAANAAAASASGSGDAAPKERRANEILDALGYDPCTLDVLMARTGLDAATLQARLLELELQGQVARLPGGLFQQQGYA